jgi:hypothetical protein
MNTTINTAYTLFMKEYAYERTTLTVIWSLVAFMALAYMYLTSITIVHAVAGKRAAAESMQAATAIASLEGEHFTLSSSLTQNDATRFALIPVQDRHFVQKTTLLSQASR